MKTGILFWLLATSASLLWESPGQEAQPIPLTTTKFVRQNFAINPVVRHPVAISVDEAGRVFVAETYRYQGRGVMDNRGKPRREMDDLQIFSLEDRERVFKLWLDSGELDRDLAERKSWYDKEGDGRSNLLTKYSEKVALLVDGDGDGVAEIRKEFSEGFNQPLDGPAAGILAWDGKVWLACVPDLWVLEDKGGDMKAEQKTSLARGFGVRAGWFGHDLHGLTMGLDGMLYFSVGDRGFNVRTKEGRHLYGPSTGAVFRCWPDGSDLQIFARGLRNPQELAFDDLGNLFTCDNNCDAGDKARLTYVMEKADYGWDVSVQSLQDRGPWLKEKLWELRGAQGDLTQPCWVVPPIAHISDGPSGLTHFPGIGLPEAYRDHFLLCDYRGGGNGGIHAFACAPHGAGFKLADHHLIENGVGVADVTFGYDGRIYVSDWGPSWDLNDASRIYTMTHEESRQLPVVGEVQKLMREGFEKRSVKDLCKLLQHADQRVRMKAQFALAARGPQESLDNTLAVVRKATGPARVHGIFAIGQMARHNPVLLSELTILLQDQDEAVRLTAARVIGNGRYPDAAPALAAALKDASPQVRAQAAMALGKMRSTALAELVESIKENDNRDPFLRHALAVGLSGATTARELTDGLSKDASPAVRLASVLALRLLEAPEVAIFLDDPEPQISLEAARAIYDLQLFPALPGLAEMLGRADFSDALKCDAFFRRVVAAALDLGRAEDAERMAKFSILPAERGMGAYQVMALEALAQWDKPPPRELVWGKWASPAPRSAGLGRAALQKVLPDLLKMPEGALLTKARELEQQLGPPKSVDDLVRLIADSSVGENLRLQYLRALESKGNAEKLVAACQQILLAEIDPRLRVEARAALVRQKPESALQLCNEALIIGSPLEKQGAVAGLLKVSGNEGEKRFMELAQLLTVQGLDPAIQVDVLEILRKRDVERSPSRKILEAYEAEWDLETDPLVPYRPALVGGDAELGRHIFYHNQTAQCLRCHAVKGKGGTAGPDLSGISQRLAQDRLLESLVLPSVKIAPGYGIVALTLKDGRQVSGILQQQDANEVVLLDAGERRTFRASEIQETSPASSAMPPMGALLTLRELRDLMAFLESL